MRSFVAFIITCALLGVFLVSAIRSYNPDFLARFTTPPAVAINIVTPEAPYPAQQNEINAIMAKFQELNLTDVKIQTVPLKDWSVPPKYQSYMWAIEVAAAFAILIPIFIVYAIINWLLKVFE